MAISSRFTCNPSEVKIAPNSLDLATITFWSDRNYVVAELGDSYMTAAELYRKQGKDRDYLDTVQKIKQLMRRY